MMKIAIGADHAGFQYKAEIIKFLKSKNYGVEDFGAFSEESVDYPDFAHPVAINVKEEKSERGILICGSGVGVSIAANKHENVRAALCWSEVIAKLSRQHNNANVICIPSRFVSLEMALSMVEVFLQTSFEGGRHSTRVNKINC